MSAFTSGRMLHPLVRQARQALASGDPLTAATLCSQRLSEERRDGNARMTLADAQLISGDADGAIANMERVARELPREPLIRIKLGHMLLREGKYRETLGAADAALKIKSDLVPALALKASVFERQNKYDKALAALDDQLTSTSPHPDAGPPAMRVLIHEGRYDEAIAFAARFTAANPKAVRAVREVRFELARAHERSGDHAAAFAAAIEANATGRTPFNRSYEAERFDGLIAATSAAAMEALPRAIDADAATTADPIVFIVGMPRTGSTLTERILHAHPDAAGMGEDPSVHRIAYRLHEFVGGTTPYPECLGSLTADAARAARTELLEAMRRVTGKSRVMVCKSLGNALHLGLIELLLPEARIIHARRNPVDTCLSCWMEPLGGAGTAYASDLDDLAWYHGQLDRMLEHARTVTTLPTMDLAYEDMVRDQRGTTERLLEFCGLAWNDACMDFHTVRRVERTLSFDQVRKPLHGGSVGRADRFGGALDGLRAALAAD